MSYQTLLYTVEDAIATITRNRPDALNTIVPPMPDEIEDAVNAAVRDERVKVMILRGAGRSFVAASISAPASTGGTSTSPPTAHGIRARTS
jgi:enoyl-CoA hydratase/carnithine racemase